MHRSGVWAAHLEWCESCQRDTETDNRGCSHRAFCATCGRDRNE